MSEQGESFVRITNREIYDAIVGLERKVDQMDTKLGGVADENFDLRKRVRSLELKTYAALSGILAALPMLGRMSGVF